MFGSKNDMDLATCIKNTESGLGDLILRVKQNLLGNNGGRFSIAILPYLKIPTSYFEQNNRYEGGLVVPMQLMLPHDWKLGFQIEGDRLKDKYEAQMHTELLQSVTISHEIIKGLDGMAETYYSYNIKEHHIANYLNAALQMSIAKDFKVDAGLTMGYRLMQRKLILLERRSGFRTMFRLIHNLPFKKYSERFN
ncbi:MAG: transporter [Flavobacterium sp.]|nr:MAG: transporter [Flavobacterium sp.]